MDIQPPGDKLLNITIQQLQKVQNDQLQLIARLAGLKTDHLAQAIISDVSELSVDDRKILIEQVDKALTQIKSLIMSPAIQQQLQALEQQKTLLQSDLTKLFQLTVNNKDFLVYSNQSLQTGQNILIRLLPNQGLELILPAVPTTNPDEQIDTLITQNLRQLLPLQKPDNFFTALAKMQQLIELLPPDPKKQLIDKPLQTSLDKLNQVIPTLTKLIDPASLKAIIENSGIQFERKLVELLTSNKQATIPTSTVSATTVTANNTVTPSLTTLNEKLSTALSQHLNSEQAGINSTKSNSLEPGQKLSTQDLSPLLTQMKSGTNNQIPTQSSALANDKILINNPVSTNNLAVNNLSANPASKIIANPDAQNLQSLQSSTNTNKPSAANRDLKGALVELVADTQRSLQQQAVDGAEIVKSIHQPHLQDFIAQIIPLLMGKTSQKDLPLKTLRAQLTALLQQHAYQAVAKIQIQQLQSILPSSTQNSQDSNPQSWQMEIPIRYQQDILPMHLQIEKRWVQQQENPDKKDRQKIKQWRVMLNFDLPVIGQFYAQLILLEQQLSATLWAEKTETLQTAKEKMENLRTKLQREGIIVTQLECLPGSPNKPQNHLNYSLIDIKT